MENPSAFFYDAGPLLVISSSILWALGSVILRHRRRSQSAFVSAGWQMLLGGLVMTLLGLVIGEAGLLHRDMFTPQAVYSFFHLLIVGSLIGFVAFNWLLGHVSTTLAGTYAYVNPVIAVLVGWLIGGEEITGWILGGMVVILVAVALVRMGGLRHDSGLGSRPSSMDETPVPDLKETSHVPALVSDGWCSGRHDRRGSRTAEAEDVTACLSSLPRVEGREST
jgi:drug/metabolite transporter (DMT)-like permease